MKQKITSTRLKSRVDLDAIEEEIRNDPDVRRQAREALAAAQATGRVFEGLTAELKQFREAEGLSLRDVSEMTGVTPGSLSLLERGKGNPTVDTLRRIAGVMNREIVITAAQPAETT